MVNIDYGRLSTDPHSILALMDQALILTGWIENSTVYGRPQLLKFEQITDFKAYRKRSVRKDKEIDVLKLVHAQGTTGFLAYICDYAENNISYQVLDDEADFCFTITMNGCTFGIGRPTKEGYVLVSHCNNKQPMEGDPQDEGQQDRQRKLDLAFHGPQVGLFEPSSYRPTARHCATTFGVRIKGSWKFYYQSYAFFGNRWAYEVYGTKKVTLTRLRF